MTIKAENDITLVRVDDGQPGAPGSPGTDGKSAYESAQDGGYIGEESQFNADLADVPNKANTNELEEVAANIEAVGEVADTLRTEVTGITDDVEALNGSVEDIDARTDTLEDRTSNELVAKGYARITDEPSLELGRSASDWKIKITNQSVDLNKSGNSGAKLSPNPDRPNETLFRTDSTRLANLYFRSADGQGKLGLVAQSNGHISLKEI